jgi:uncharacterized protein (DUF1330 family)
VPLFLLSGTGQHAEGLLTTQGVLFFVILFPLCFTILYVSEHLRGGVWSAVLVHAAWNGSAALLPAYGDAGAWWQTGVACGIAVVLGVLWRVGGASDEGTDVVGRRTSIRPVTGAEPTGPYYVILDVAISDVERYLTYMAQVTPALEAAGGRYLARGGAVTTYEGDWHPPRIVLMEFPSQQAWESFYFGRDYEGIKPIRDEVSTGRMIGVEGLPPGVPAAQAPPPRAAEHGPS